MRVCARVCVRVCSGEIRGRAKGLFGVMIPHLLLRIISLRSTFCSLEFLACLPHTHIELKVNVDFFL